MDEVVGALRQEASPDSAGVFTLDLQRARQKLQRFQLPSAHHYVLPMVACAVAGGASSVAYIEFQHHYMVELPGLAFDFAQCQAAFAEVGGSDALGYFTLAVQAAAGLTGFNLVATTWTGQGGARIVMAGGRPQLSALEERPWPEERKRTRLVLSPWLATGLKLDRFLRSLAGWPPAPDPALELLKAYCCYSPVPIHSSSRELTLTRQGRWRTLGVVNGQKLARRLPPLSVQRELPLADPELPFAGYLGMGPGGGGVLVVVDGLLYPLPLEAPHPDFRAILWHSGLPRDLSLLKLVEGPALEEFRRQLLGLFEKLT